MGLLELVEHGFLGIATHASDADLVNSKSRLAIVNHEGSIDSAPAALYADSPGGSNLTRFEFTQIHLGTEFKIPLCALGAELAAQASSAARPLRKKPRPPNRQEPDCHSLFTTPYSLPSYRVLPQLTHC